MSVRLSAFYAMSFTQPKCPVFISFVGLVEPKFVAWLYWLDTLKITMYSSLIEPSTFRLIRESQINILPSAQPERLLNAIGDSFCQEILRLTCNLTFYYYIYTGPHESREGGREMEIALRAEYLTPNGIHRKYCVQLFFFLALHTSQQPHSSPHGTTRPQATETTSANRFSHQTSCVM
jgi:hypothetical protein